VPDDEQQVIWIKHLSREQKTAGQEIKEEDLV